jgi:hypothetical protein
VDDIIVTWRCSLHVFLVELRLGWLIWCDKYCHLHSNYPSAWLDARLGATDTWRLGCQAWEWGWLHALAHAPSCHLALWLVEALVCRHLARVCHSLGARGRPVSLVVAPGRAGLQTREAGCATPRSWPLNPRARCRSGCRGLF